MFDLPVQGNERDVEIPLLINFLTKNDVKYCSALDVGCAQSFYLPFIRNLVGHLSGVDLLFQKELAQYLDEYIVGNFLFEDLSMVDWVFSVSTIEHIGIEYLPSKLYRELQLEAFAKMLNLARFGLFITFPYGEDILFDGHYYSGNRCLLDDYLKIARGCKIKKIFLSTPDPKDPMSWREIPQDLADKATNFLSGCVQTICVLEVYK